MPVTQFHVRISYRYALRYIESLCAESITFPCIIITKVRYFIFFVVFAWSGSWKYSWIAMIWDTMTCIWCECIGLNCDPWIWKYNVLIIYPLISMLTLPRLQYFMDCCIFCPVSDPILDHNAIDLGCSMPHYANSVGLWISWHIDRSFGIKTDIC